MDYAEDPGNVLTQYLQHEISFQLNSLVDCHASANNFLCDVEVYLAKELKCQVIDRPCNSNIYIMWVFHCGCLVSNYGVFEGF